MIDAEMYYEHHPSESKPTLTKLNQDIDKPDQEGEPNDTELMLCSRIIRGFSLQSKKWSTYRDVMMPGLKLTGIAQFFVDCVEDIPWQDNVIENLVLSEDHKDLVLGFVECHRGTEDEFDDFIEGKGRSLIFLLSGPPGVGKTLTAEAGEKNPKNPKKQG
jgi:hypothetical protein